MARPRCAGRSVVEGAVREKSEGKGEMTYKKKRREVARSCDPVDKRAP